MATEAKVSIQIPEAEVRAHITTAVGQALSKNKDSFVKAIVEEALNKPQSPYNRSTPLEDAVKKLVREESQAAVTAWVESHRGLIQERVKAALASNDYANAIAKAVCDSALNNVYATVGATVTLVRRESSED